MQPPTFPAPPSLALLLKAAGFRVSLLVEREDGQPLSDKERALISKMLDAHGDGEDVSDDVLCQALVDRGFAPWHVPAKVATGTDGS
jgi:hypothetical protein